MSTPSATKKTNRTSAVIAIVAAVVVAPFVAFVFAHRASVQETRTASHAKIDARILHPVAEKYRVEHPKEPCPTMEVLRDAREIPASAKLTDPWGSTYQILCAGEDDITIFSFGPDMRQGTADDIRIPDWPPSADDGGRR